MRSIITTKATPGWRRSSGDVSIDCAIARASHDAPGLGLSFPGTAAGRAVGGGFENHSRLAASTWRPGNALGQAAAQSIIVLRTGDGSQIPEPQVGVNFFPMVGPRLLVDRSRQQEHDGARRLLEPGQAVRDQFGLTVPPATTAGAEQRGPIRTAFCAPRHLAAIRLNGTPTSRNARETFMGTYWTYDGTPSLCAPPRLYNQIARTLAVAGRTAQHR